MSHANVEKRRALWKTLSHLSSGGDTQMRLGQANVSGLLDKLQNQFCAQKDIRQATWQVSSADMAQCFLPFLVEIHRVQTQSVH